VSCVVVFGREPVSGRVKSRLATGVGEELAAAVYRELLEHTLWVAASIDADVVLALAEPPARGWRPERAVEVEVQVAGDLGRRLADAFDRRFAEGYQRVVVAGSDCPELAPHHLEGALDGLTRHPVVLGPACDGGYWLVGVRAPALDLFTDIPWSTPEVLDATRARLRALGVSWLELERLHDLDTEADLRWALDGETLSDELRNRLQATARSIGRACAQ
jgi:rSAM/selenodomain-associated transferase 1